MLTRQSFVFSGPLAGGFTVGSVETTTKIGVSKYLRIEFRQTKPQLLLFGNASTTVKPHQFYLETAQSASEFVCFFNLNIKVLLQIIM